MACLEKKWPWENDFNSKNKASVTQKSYLQMTDMQIATFSDHRLLFTTTATSLSHPFTNLSGE